MNRRTYYRHRQRIEAEGAWRERSRRPKTSPGRTPAAVEAEIVRLRGELCPDNGADMIIAELARIAARDGWAQRGLRVPHRSTVNKVLKRDGLVTPQPGKRPKSSFRRFAYARPRDCYQVDATEVKLADGGTAVVFDVLDDCTRLLAACQRRGRRDRRRRHRRRSRRRRGRVRGARHRAVRQRHRVHRRRRARGAAASAVQPRRDGAGTPG